MPARDPEIDQTARLLMEWSAHCMRLWRGNAHAQALVETGLTLQQIIALHVLFFAPATSVSTLTERLGLSVSATSHLVQRLVEQGVVVRAEDPADRRQRRLSLSASGRKLVERLARARLAEFRLSVGPLSSGTRALLRAALQRAVTEMAEISPEGDAAVRPLASKPVAALSSSVSWEEE